ncbi:MAG: hypothetical protein EPN94_09050 [Nitrospirae bacterium]|nr:MAG: hypothetical protein EPN94_09050 [Nitrospirota bacterium]
MKRVSAVVMTMLFGLLSASLYAAEKDAVGCKDHPLIPRMQDYYIVGCSNALANFDADIANGKNTETVHIEGNSMALLYSPQPGLKSKLSEPQLRSDFENAVKKQGGRLFGATPGQKWPIYKIVKDGKEFWIVLMVNSGKYFTGSYGYRIIEK